MPDSNDNIIDIQALEKVEDNQLSELKETNEVYLSIIPDKPTIETISTKEALKRFAKLAVPFSIMGFIGMGGEFAAAIILSRSNEKHLAASGFITVINNFVLTSSSAALYSTSILMGETIAKAKLRPKRLGEVGKILNTSYTGAVLLAVTNTVLLFCAEPLLNQLGQNKNITKLVGNYYKSLIFSGGPLAIMLAVSGQQTAFAVDKSIMAVAFHIGRRAIYVGTGYWLINGGLGLPALGTSGLALANSLSSWAEAVSYISYYKLNKSLSAYGFFKHSLPKSLKYLKRLFSRSLLLAIQSFNEYFNSFFNANLIGRMGIEQLAALEIVNQYHGLVNIPMMSASQASGIEVSKLFKKDALSARKVGRIALACSLLIPMIVIPVFVFAGKLMADPFVPDTDEDGEKIIEIAKLLILITGLNELPNTIRSVCSGILRGYDSFAVSTIVSIISLSLIGLPASYALGFLTELSSTGVYLGSSIALGSGAVSMFSFWKYKDSKAATLALTQDQEQRAIEDIEVEGSEQYNNIASNDQSPNSNNNSIDNEEQRPNLRSYAAILPCTII